MSTTNNINIPNFAQNNYLRLFLERDHLNHSNFVDWYRNLRIVLKPERRLYVLQGPIPEEPPQTPRTAHQAWSKHADDSIEVVALMLATMIPELQKNLINHSAYSMIMELKDMFQQQARLEHFETVRTIHNTRMAEGESVSAHVLNMKGHIDHLERLECPYPLPLATDLILNSLPKSFDSFILNYNMNGWEKSLSELHQMLKTAERNLPKHANPVLNIREGGVKRAHTTNPSSRGKGKAQGAKGKGKKPVQTPPPKKAKSHANDTCLECNQLGHWRRNCPVYLAKLKSAKVDASTSGGIYVITVNLFNFQLNSWVFDTGCGTHICNCMQGFRLQRKLQEGEVILHVGNGATVAAESIGT
jgi:hypothetical protein